MAIIGSYDSQGKPLGYEQLTVSSTSEDIEIRNGELTTTTESVAEQTGQWKFTFEADGGNENFAEGDTVKVAGNTYTGAASQNLTENEFDASGTLNAAIDSISANINAEDRFTTSGTAPEIIVDESAGEATGETVTVQVTADDVKLSEAGVEEETKSIKEVLGEYEIEFTALYEDTESVIFKGDGFTNARVEFDEAGAGDLEVNVGDFTDTDSMATEIATALNTQTGASDISENQTITVEDSTITIKEDEGDADGNDIEVEDKLAYINLTRPTGATKAMIGVESNTIRFRHDGERPTSSVGFPITAGSEFILPSRKAIDNFKTIADSADGTINVLYYGSDVN